MNVLILLMCVFVSFCKHFPRREKASIFEINLVGTFEKSKFKIHSSCQKLWEKQKKN